MEELREQRNDSIQLPPAKRECSFGSARAQPLDASAESTVTFAKLPPCVEPKCSKMYRELQLDRKDLFNTSNEGEVMMNLTQS